MSLKKKEIENRYISIDIKQEEKAVKIFIKDNAGGIDNEVINRIFDSHFTTKLKSEGTGVGLYMSKEIIEKHMNGQITVSNEEILLEDIYYKGACFEIIVFKEESI